MNFWLDLARGPIFQFSFVLMILGLMRYAVLTGIGIRRIVTHAGNPAVSYGSALSVSRAIPGRNLSRIYESASCVMKK